MPGILVFAETRDNKLKKAGLEAVSTAASIGEKLGLDTETLVIGSSVSEIANELSETGTSKVLLAEDSRLEKYATTAYAKIFADAAKRGNYNFLFLSATAMGKDLGPRTAAKLDAGLAVDCSDLNVKDGDVIATRPVYAGKAYVDLKLNSPVKMYSIRPNVFKIVRKEKRTPAIEKLELNLSDSDFLSHVEEITVSSDKIDVAEASIIVSGGRGLRGPENYYLVENLAKVLNAGVGASRAVVDAGWRPHAEQVGQTGKTVSPSLYIACGISGAIQHLAGMSSSKCIVAINKDKDAPIFQIADYGIVGDVFEILPALTEEFKKVLSN